MPKIKVLIGLPGSGKTSLAEKLAALDPGWVHLSLDRIAHELYGPEQAIEHSVVFQHMFNQTAAALENGKNVIYDATNLSSKRRKSLLHRLERLDTQIETEAVIFLTPYHVLFERNDKRDNWERVPEKVMTRYIRSFEFPRRNEFFHQQSFMKLGIKESVREKTDIQNLLSFDNISLEEVQNFYDSFPETQPFICMDNYSAFSKHAWELVNLVKENALSHKELQVLYCTALLHEIGKAYVRKNRPIAEDNFHGFEHASSYHAYPVLVELGFPPDFIENVILIIDEHVLGRRLKRGKLKRRIGEENYGYLLKFWELKNQLLQENQ